MLPKYSDLLLRWINSNLNMCSCRDAVINHICVLSENSGRRGCCEWGSVSRTCVTVIQFTYGTLVGIRERLKGKCENAGCMMEMIISGPWARFTSVEFLAASSQRRLARIRFAATSLRIFRTLRMCVFIYFLRWLEICPAEPGENWYVRCTYFGKSVFQVSLGSVKSLSSYNGKCKNNFTGCSQQSWLQV